MNKYNILTLLLVISLSFLQSPAHTSSKLIGKEPSLCYECHKELKERLSDKYTHFLFKKGKCSSCHNPHASNIKGLMNDEINSLCLNCHKGLNKLLKNANIHGAIKDGTCTDCHYAHSGENKNLLLKPEKELCWKCHEDLKEQLERPFSCLAFKEGKCSSCHNSHASKEENLLLSAPIKTCKECHKTIGCKAGKISISSVTKNTDCTTCHSGHSSDKEGVLGPFGHKVFLDKDCEKCHNPFKDIKKITTRIEGEGLCFSCHKKEDSVVEYIDNDVHVKDIKNSCTLCHDFHASGKKDLTKNESKFCIKCHEYTEKRTASMEKALKSIKCTPVKDRKCFECHVPLHSSRPLNYRKDSFSLCERCHKAQHKITHPLGPDIIDVRNGQPITCISCHSMHSAKADFMLTFDRKRALCIQCHKK